ncbi:peroxiredoxin [Hwanghaeella grinnelliae]|uniref:Alkyl hydroperoxide reductase C n=1 Tax=Hwanghaeella grinnelliae TaxID=2500179 RepID=A0A3S2W8Z2_9PROT|nr:peroxiredoxin [Hwanghaeella grinnelliae]RVU36128.1 peroxiredoxin [Hwanghaeella grinnelliae]
MTVRINDIVPDFKAETSDGSIDFYDWAGDGWVLLFAHPRDFTPVCTTELGQLARLQPEFAQRNCKIIGLSTDTVADHLRWKPDIEKVAGVPLSYPLIADSDLRVAKVLDMVPSDVGVSAKDRTEAHTATVRSVFVIGPEKRILMMQVYPMQTGRNFDEVLRVLDALQTSAAHSVATPANWRKGEDVIIPSTLTDDQAMARYPQGWRTVTPYLRFIADPSES